jgi:hypothetical protein
MVDITAYTGINSQLSTILSRLGAAVRRWRRRAHERQELMLLDNMTIEQNARGRGDRGWRAVTEASGRVTAGDCCGNCRNRR